MELLWLVFPVLGGIIGPSNHQALQGFLLGSLCGPLSRPLGLVSEKKERPFLHAGRPYIRRQPSVPIAILTKAESKDNRVVDMMGSVFVVACWLFAVGSPARAAEQNEPATAEASHAVEIEPSPLQSPDEASAIGLAPDDGEPAPDGTVSPDDAAATSPPADSANPANGDGPSAATVAEDGSTAPLATHSPKSPVGEPVKDRRSSLATDMRSRLDTHDPLFLICLVLGLISLVSVSITFWLYRWRRLLLNNEAVLVPERWAAAIDSQTLSHQQMSNALVSTTARIESLQQENWAKLGELNETIDAMRNAVTERDKTIQRLQEGQDTFVFHKFLARFIRVHKEFDAQHQEEEGADIELLRDLIWQALEECGVETFTPELGSDYLTAEGVADRPTIDGCSDPSQQNTISRVLEPGYCIPNGNDSKIVLPARVAVWRVPVEPEKKE